VAKQLHGAGAGAFAAVLANSSGAMAGLHEVVGHGYLGGAATSGSGYSFTYYVDSFDRLNEIGKAHSFQDGISAFFRWIGEPGSGGAYIPHTQPNGIGEALGPDGRSAWISLAGSVPGCLIDVMAVVSGMHLRRRSPALGSALIAFGFLDHLSSVYPISAALMSHSEMVEQAKSGHDFANFAIKISDLTGTSAQAIAIATAAVYTAIVPIAALFAYLRTKSSVNEGVPDALAMRHWILKAEKDPKIAKELEALLARYSEKQELEKTFKKLLAADAKPLSMAERNDLERQVLRFTAYLLDKIPVSALEKSKGEIIAAWDKNVPQDKIGTSLAIAAGVGTIGVLTARTLSLLASTVAPSLQTAATVLTYLSPLFLGASVASAAYQVYKDFQCPDAIVPKKAKMLSVARLIATIATAAVLGATLFIPGLNLVLICTLMAGAVVSLLLSYARSRVIQQQFALMKSLEPDTWNVMNRLWLEHQKTSPGKAMSPALKRWVDCVKPVQTAPISNSAKRPSLYVRV